MSDQFVATLRSVNLKSVLDVGVCFSTSSSVDTGNVSSLLGGPTLGESTEAPADVILGSCAWHTHAKHQVFSALLKTGP